MVKVILFFVLICYTIYRVGGFVVKILSFGSTDSKNSVHKNGNIRVDKQPTKGNGHFDGGEYVDFEEVK